MKLSSEQQQLLAANGPTPVELTDDRGRVYYLISAEQYSRLRRVLEDFDPRSAYPAIEKIMEEDDEQDPLLENYQQYRRNS